MVSEIVRTPLLAAQCVRWCSLLCGVLLAVAGCTQPISGQEFVGEWTSSRTLTPIHVVANGEWEIRADDGAVLQYGLWRYEHPRLIWTLRQAQRLQDDVTVVLSVQPDEFRLREANGEVTVFHRR